MQKVKQKMLKKMKKTNKSGFTLAEMLCALAIVGILTALALTVMKPAEKSAMKYLYMNAYTALEKAFYNATIDGCEPFSDLPDEDGNSPVHSETQDTGTKNLCEGLTTYINTTSNVKTDEDDFADSCSDTKLADIKGDDFSSDAVRNNIQFTATNGMEFYISKRLHSVEHGFYFYLVFVDINGKKAPNSLEYTYKGGKEADDYDESDPDEREQKYKDRIEPDIFAFALLDTGKICPIGIAEYDSNILTARFAYFKSNGEILYTKKSMAYYQAKGAAWGYYNAGGPNLDTYNEDEPFTMNDVIRNAIKQESSESVLVKDFPDLESLEPVTTATESPYFCSNDDMESCYIFLDRYSQG